MWPIIQIQISFLADFAADIPNSPPHGRAKLIATISLPVVKVHTYVFGTLFSIELMPFHPPNLSWECGVIKEKN